VRDEYWATFSIYDHRTSLFRQALILFDRIVVPIPTRAFGGVSREEIDRLDAEVQFLETEGAAKKVAWDPDEFADWRREAGKPAPGQQEAVARKLVKDPPYLTRLQLKEQTEAAVARALPEGAISVTAIPVYGTRESYEDSTAELKGHMEERVTLEVLMNQIPTPAESVSFEDILRLRNKPTFQASLTALRNWQRATVRELLEEGDDASIKRAGRDFNGMISKYAEALNDARYEKVTTAVGSMLAIGTVLGATAGPLVGAISALASPLFSIRKLMKPCWKDLEERQCFPAGVVYEAKRLA